MKGGAIKLTGVAPKNVHYMQTMAWAGIRKQAGWKHHVLAFEDAQMLVYHRLVPGLGYLYYVPDLSGVTVANAATFTKLLKLNCKKGFAVRLELDQRTNEAVLSALKDNGWVKSRRHMQYRHTVVIDLKPEEDEIWMNLKSRGRYEVLQAKKAEVEVMAVDPTDENFEKMYELMQTTSTRNKFYIRDKEFTFSYWRRFREANQLQLWFAGHEGDLLAGAVILTSGKHAWYKDGGSNRYKSNLMAARVLHWEIIKHLKAKKFTQYDLSGIPDPEKHQTSSMHGIYVFKSAFSKGSVTLMPTMELPLTKRYKLWPKLEANWLRTYNLFARSLWY